MKKNKELTEQKNKEYRRRYYKTYYIMNRQKIIDRSKEYYRQTQVNDYWTIYYLMNDETKEVIWIGVTKLLLSARLAKHISNAKFMLKRGIKYNHTKQEYMNEMFNNNVSVSIHQIEQQNNKIDAFQREKEIIYEFSKKNDNSLLNNYSSSNYKYERNKRL